MTPRAGVLPVAFAIGVLCAAPAPAAQNFQCEVMNVQGSASAVNDKGRRPLKQGDLLNAGETVEVESGAFLDIAYDRDWNNVVRFEGGSEAKMKLIVPGQIELSNGGVFARIKKLPRDSSFEVTTPTAVASVRGTEYHVVFSQKQGTDVVNMSPDSRVMVFGRNPDGSVNKESRVLLGDSSSSRVSEAGKMPSEPEGAPSEGLSAAAELSRSLDANVREAMRRGRTGRIQSITEIEEYIESQKTEDEALLPLRRS